MPDNMRYDANGQPLGYGDPVDPSLYPQADPAWGQYPQGYGASMPSPQEIYAQQYADPTQMGQGYMDPTQMYADPNQGMYGQPPLQQDPYYGCAQAGYPEADPSLSGQIPYGEADQQYMQGYAPTQGYGQMPPVQDPAQMQGYPSAAPQGYGQMPQPVQQPQQAQAPMPQAAPVQASPSPVPEPVSMPEAMDKKAAKAAAKEQKRVQKQREEVPVPVGPAPSAGKATLFLILGILSVIFAVIPPIGIILGLVVRMMYKSYRRAGGRAPKAETGNIFATVGLIFGLVMLVVIAVLCLIIWAGLYGESMARQLGVFWNNSPFGTILWRIPIPSPL